MSTETPETDAAIADPKGLKLNNVIRRSRSLERRNSELKAELKQMRAERDSNKISVQIVQANRDEWERSWGVVSRERDAAVAEKAELTARIAELERLLTASLGFATEALGDAYQSVSVSVRENIAGSIRALRLQLAEARKDSAWQPIETAPKDGTEIQGWLSCSARWVPRVRWSATHKLWEHYSLDRWIILYPQYLTHWMPLPATPLPETEAR